MIFVQKNWKMLQKVPKRTLFFVFKIAIMNVTHKVVTSGTLTFLCLMRRQEVLWLSSRTQSLPIQHGRNRGMHSLPQLEQLRFNCFGSCLLDVPSSQPRLNSGDGCAPHPLTFLSTQTLTCSMWCSSLLSLEFCWRAGLLYCTWGLRAHHLAWRSTDP